MIAGLCRPPPQTSQRRGGAGSGAAATASAVNATSVAAPSGGDSASSPLAASAAAKSSRSSDFGAGRAKYGCASSRASTAAIDPPRPRQRAVAVERARRCAARTQSSSGPLPGPVSNASSAPSGADPGHVRRRRRCSAPPAASADRAPARRDRPARAAPPAPPAATSAERKSYATGMPVRQRQRRGVADLPGPPPVRLVQDGLAVEADQVGRPAQRRDRRGHGTRSAAPRRVFSRRSSGASVGATVQDAAQVGAQPVVVGQRQRRAEARRCARRRSPARPRPPRPATCRSSARSRAAFSLRLPLC